MSAETIFVSFLDRGIILDTDGHRIGITPAVSLNDGDRASIRANKAQLIGLLSDPEALARIIARFCEAKSADLAHFLDRNLPLQTILRSDS